MKNCYKNNNILKRGRKRRGEGRKMLWQRSLKQKNSNLKSSNKIFSRQVLNNKRKIKKWIQRRSLIQLG